MSSTSRNVDVPDYCVERNSIVKTQMLIRIWELAQAGPIDLLDVGCGGAEWLVPLLDNTPAIIYHGVEPQARLAERARLNLPRFAENIRTARGEDLPAPFGKQFGIVISRAALEHVYHREAFLDQVSGVVARDGVLLLTYGSNHFKQDRRTDLRNLASQAIARLGVDRFYTAPVDEARLTAALERNGLTIEERKYYSLDDIKAAHKLVAEPRASREALLRWLELENLLNAEAGDLAAMRKLTNEAYFGARRVS